MTDASPPRLDPRTAVGPVTLRVRDRARLEAWYRAALGLVPLATRGPATVLGVADGTPLVTLLEDPAAAPGDRRRSGLFHVAVLLPARADLGRWLTHAGASGLRLEGAADHLVSEAVYLSDPEGNGIEVYRDRPRGEWPTRGGRIHMDNAPLDADGILAEARRAGGRYDGAPAGTVVGHVHLRVADLAATRAFYEGAVGLDVTEEGFPSALFVSAGGYHHHLGLNTWHSAGRRRADGEAGLDAFTLALPDGAVEGLADALAAAGHPVDRTGAFPVATDPSGNRMAIVGRPVDAEAALAVAGA